MAKARPSTAAPYPRTTYIGNPPVSRPLDWQQLFRNMAADLPGVLAVGGPRPDHLRRRYPGNEICESMPDALQFVIDGAARYYPDVDLRPLRKLLTGLPITPEVLAEAQVAASELADVTLRDRPGKPNAKPPASNPPATATDGPPEGAIFDANSGKLTLDGKVYSLGNSARYVLAILVTKRSALYGELREGDGRPDRVLRRLLVQIPAARRYITLPRGKGKGGYKTTIQPSAKRP